VYNSGDDLARPSHALCDAYVFAKGHARKHVREGPLRVIRQDEAEDAMLTAERALFRNNVKGRTHYVWMARAGKKELEFMIEMYKTSGI
jgi:hypothetical protein